MLKSRVLAFALNLDASYTSDFTIIEDYVFLIALNNRSLVFKSYVPERNWIFSQGMKKAVLGHY